MHAASLLKVSSISATLFAVAVANAQVAYNGDFRFGDTNVTQADTLSDQWVYDEVDVLSPHVTTIWGNFMIYTEYAHSSLGLKYQIRTGVSQGNGGSLIKSGSVSNLQQTLTGRSTQNGFYPEVQLLGTVDFDLAPGVYWLGLQNDEGSNPPAQWTSFLSQTVGSDYGPGGDPNPAPQNSILNQSAFVTGAEGGDWLQLGSDYSVGIASVPEPASCVALGGLALLALRRRRPRGC